MKRILSIVMAVSGFVVFAQQAEQVGAPPDLDARYATDAYPGFDVDRDASKPERKEPRWFGWINGPKKDSASEQLSYCRELEAAENWSKAIKHYDALVREWPAAAEAVTAQRRLADLLLEKEEDLDEAFAAYRYLIDFYSFQCDYNNIADLMYEIAQKMEAEGKWIVFFHFRNTVEVRHAFEACVLRAPGAKWAPAALLSIARFREDEGRDNEAVAVYENLRNLHYGSDEAKKGALREAEARLRILDEHGYNRVRCLDTVQYLRLASGLVDEADRPRIAELLADAQGRLEEEAYRAAAFYDSPMRTKRSAITAYEQFLIDFPGGKYAPDVTKRLSELKGSNE